jgi:transcriptional regulator with XRE-family HTH domain
MNKPQWTHDHGVLLESLRMKAGMSHATLARRAMLSVLQVEQLELGGDSGFYNAEIKFATGKKLLQFFGHTLKVEVTPPNSNTHEPLQVVPAQSPEPKKRAFKVSGLSGALVLMAMLLALFWLAQQSSNSSNKASPEVTSKVTPPQPSQEVTTAAPISSSTTDNQTLSASSSSSSSSSTSQTETSRPLNSPCAWEPTETEIQPASPRKKGEYVHVVAIDNVSICIMDGNQRVANVTLAPGQARSIYGPAPFKLYSTQLALVNIYFQGVYIKLPNPEARQIKLKTAGMP